MKVAMLIQCHINPDQINDYISMFNPNVFDFFIHVDAKSKIQPKIQNLSNVYFVPDTMRQSVYWGGYTQVKASMCLIRTAIEHKCDYDFYWLCSGQDFPIRPSEEIEKYLSNRINANFIDLAASRNHPINEKFNPGFDKRYEVYHPQWLIKSRRGIKKAVWVMYVLITGGTNKTYKIFRRQPPNNLKIYFGSQWWCLGADTIKWIVEYVNMHPELERFFKYTICSDEFYYQTLVMNSPYKDSVYENLVYLDWSERKGSPKILTLQDWPQMMKSGKLIARKIESFRDKELYERLKQIK